MKLVYEADLSAVHIFAQGPELASIMGRDTLDGKRQYSWPEDHEVYVTTFSAPVLVTDNHEIGLLDPVLRDTVFALFSSGIKTTVYDEVAFSFDQSKYPGLWGPSIDTLFFTMALRGLDLTKTRKAVEIGAGSGFISKYLLSKNSRIESLTLIDINRHAVDCWAAEINDQRAKFHVGDAVEFLEGKRYDLIFCNPPYIPRPKSIDDNPYEGVGLFTHLVAEADSLLTQEGKMMLNISSLSEPEFQAEIDKSGMLCRRIAEMTVPLKVFNVLNNSKWMDFLMDRGLKPEMRNGYEFWHTITMYEVAKRS